ncbi:MAG: hypothetical protein RL651_913 [Pseudomonadota bacterium]|jgi:hypothetical protein
MNFVIDQNLLALIIEAVKLPHVTVMVGMLATLGISAWVFK